MLSAVGASVGAGDAAADPLTNLSKI